MDLAKEIERKLAKQQSLKSFYGIGPRFLASVQGVIVINSECKEGFWRELQVTLHATHAFRFFIADCICQLL